MNSCIYLDIGNSNTKWKFQGKYFEIPTNEFNLDKLPKSRRIWVSNVSSNFVLENRSDVLLVESQKSYKSLMNSYEEPNMLGSDRWLAMIASYEMNSGEGFIVLDIGTAVTIDLVDDTGLYIGGVIFPGLKKIRNTFDYFPVAKEVNTNEIYPSTARGWSNGTLGLLVSGINQRIHDIKVSVPGLRVYLTGGGFEEVEKFLDFSYDYRKNLVLDGIEFFANNMG